jgi:phenylalanyl-tRNA synthetase beta chain
MPIAVRMAAGCSRSGGATSAASTVRATSGRRWAFFSPARRRRAAGRPARRKASTPFDAKARALALLELAGAPVANLQVMGEAGPQFHPGQSATLRLGPKTVLARFGALHPATLKAFDIAGR